jgi:hypothetical protein
VFEGAKSSPAFLSVKIIMKINMSVEGVGGVMLNNAE